MVIGVVLGLLFAVLVVGGVLMFLLGTKKTSKTVRAGRTAAPAGEAKPIWKILRWAGSAWVRCLRCCCF